MILKAFTLFLLLMSSNLSHAETMFFYCASEKLLKCFNLTEYECSQSSEKSFDLCADKHNPSSKKYKDNEKLLTKVVACSYKQFLLIASITKKDLNTCNTLLKEATKHEILRAQQMSHP